MRLVFLGSGEFAVPTLRWLTTSAHEVPLVVTQPARESGRGRRVTPTPVAQCAKQLQLPLLEVENVNDPAVVSQLWSLEARVGLVIAFGQFLGDGVMSAFPCGCVNLHASLLPKYRGAAPIQWAVAAGERETGVTVFRIVKRMDAGPILAQASTPIGTEETAGELHDRLAELGVGVVDQTLAQLSTDNPTGRNQVESQVSLARKLVKRDGFVDFGKNVEEILRHVRAMTPWPGAVARFEGVDGRWENVALLRVRAASGPRGEVGVIDHRFLVGAKDGFIEIVELKPSSGRAMSWADYRNGRRVSPGDRFTLPE